MINVKKFKNLGKANHGWLNANFHFSFAEYYDRNNMNFGQLRVVNDDLIEPHMGFDMHSHENMEIITYVRKGVIAHKDNAGNKGITKAGEVQVMSAGSGIYHSENNPTDDITNLYQIWIIPNKKNVKPRWDQATFPKTPVSDALPILVSGRAEDADKGALFIHQDAVIYGGNLAKCAEITHPIKYQAYLLLSEGEIEVDGKRLSKGDAAAITEQLSVSIKPLTDAEMLIIDIPSR